MSILHICIWINILYTAIVWDKEIETVGLGIYR